MSHRTGPAMAALAAFALTGAACATSPRSASPAAANPSASPPRVAAQPPTAIVDPLPSWRLDWARGAVFYQVFVRSFADSDGDGIGDLRGLISRLDYLNDGDPATRNDLGVDALWLMPVFVSPSYHGYDTVDYEHINPPYGTDADFATLLREAHRRGMRVIVDLVLNHSSAQHPWFVEASSSPTAARRNWYVWRGEDPGWTQPWGGSHRVWHPSGDQFFYGVFWSGMPDLNWRNPDLRAELYRIAERWLTLGVDGFRLDATRHLVENGPDQQQVDQPETHAALRELARVVRQRHPEALLVGENWTETPLIAAYFGSDREVPGGDELPASFNFPLAAAIVGAARDGDGDAVRSVLAEMAAAYPRRALDAPFLANHDMARLTTQLGGDVAAQRRAAALLLTLPGAPFLYYGEEIGLENGPARGDEAKRTPMPWSGQAPGYGFTAATVPWHPFSGDPQARNVAAELSDEGSLLAHYRRWIAARRASPALRDGDLFLLDSGRETGVVAFVRRTDGERALVVHNLARSAAKFAAPMSCDRLAVRLSDGDVRLAELPRNGCLLDLPPQSAWLGTVRSD